MRVILTPIIIKYFYRQPWAVEYHCSKDGITIAVDGVTREKARLLLDAEGFGEVDCRLTEPTRGTHEPS